MVPKDQRGKKRKGGARSSESGELFRRIALFRAFTFAVLACYKVNARRSANGENDGASSLPSTDQPCDILLANNRLPRRGRSSTRVGHRPEANARQIELLRVRKSSVQKGYR